MRTLLDILNARLAKGEITAQEYDSLRARIGGDQQASPNVPLIIISTIILILAGAQGAFTQQQKPDLSPAEAFGVGILGCLVWPLLVIWLRALWNTVVPPMTGWPRIRFWQACGLLLLGLFLHV